MAIDSQCYGCVLYVIHNYTFRNAHKQVMSTRHDLDRNQVRYNRTYDSVATVKAVDVIHNNTGRNSHHLKVHVQNLYKQIRSRARSSYA